MGRVRQRDRDRAACRRDDEEIAQATGYTVPMIRAVLRTLSTTYDEGPPRGDSPQATPPAGPLCLHVPGEPTPAAMSLLANCVSKRRGSGWELDRTLAAPTPIPISPPC